VKLLERTRTPRAAQGPRLGESVVNTDGHVIGLDIGATAVRAAILSPARDGEPGMSLNDLGEAELPVGTVVDGVVAEPAELTRALAALWKAHDFGCRNVVIGVSNPQVVVRAMTMPRLSRDQQAKALPYRAKDIVAMPLDQALLDFQELGPVEGEPDNVAGLLIAAPRQPVLTAVRAVEAAGLRIVRVDLSSFATLRSTAAAGVPCEAVVDIGAQMTTVVIHHLGIPKVVRTLPRGGQHLTERLVDRTGASVVEAEILKREIGLLGGDSEVSMILNGAVRPLITDIRGSIQYFGGSEDAAVVERISLTGGGGHLPGLVDMLTEDTGVPCYLMSPLQHLRVAMDAPGGQHADTTAAATAVSVGLAMGAAA